MNFDVALKKLHPKGAVNDISYKCAFGQNPSFRQNAVIIT